MVYIGFVIKKNELWFSVVKKDGDQYSIECMDKRNFQSDTEFSTLMEHFYKVFSEILTKYSPDLVVLKISLNNAKLEQIPYLYCPYGILGYICKKNNIRCITKSSSWITAKKEEKLSVVKEKFHTNKFNKDQLHATTLAYYSLSQGV